MTRASLPGRYPDIYDSARRDPEAFWLGAAQALDWADVPQRAFAPDSGPYGRWFPDGTLNACHNAVDRHADGARADQVAIRYDSPVTGTKRSITYRALRDEVAVLAAVLAGLGVGKGDRVILYMPMVPEALFGMLACARLGAVHSVVFGGFAANELAVRIEDAAPKVVLAASCGIEPNRVVAYKPLLDAAIAASRHKPEACLILQRPQAAATLMPERDRDWAETVAAARAAGQRAACVPVAATDPLYILYTSGTTGKPKGVVRDTGGYLVALAWSMPNLYGVQPGETYFCASDIGWVVGHSYIVYAPLLHGCTTVLYEGKPVGTPDAGAFWRVVAEYGVVCLFTAPTALRAIKKEDSAGARIADYDLSAFRSLFLAGERADPDSVAWAERVLNRPVIDHWWQTETGWPIAGNPMGLGLLPVKHGSTCVPMPGYRVEVLDEGGKPVPAGTMGTIAIRLPLPPGCLPTLWGSDARMRSSYLSTFPGYYDTSDAGVIDADGYITVLGRTDDIINVAGHRLSTGGMEAVLAGHPDVAECAVIGIRDALKGEVPCGFVVLKAGVDRPTETIERELVAKVRDEIGPVAAFKLALTVPRLPKTRSGKILRATMKRIADHEPWTMPATIDDAAALDEIDESLKGRGIGAD
ncbi:MULTISPECIES: propionyl-CoA synthetase [Methylobacterium]|uniref:AMP-dependent synthetase n=3 Tax=Methylobacterium TaxID=407 RepID=A0A089NNT7_9HYPH|nr:MULTISPECIES: propionyl-CoA synthetase [Methylobacterium]AIQ89042.1 AMP-dependent synthetase [Methylobacterium oryzae CBMB20]MBA9065558.1 propionyl-CoA synthetase [Methylobacterium fujisawaense]MDH3029925.1 propionyl-CoA synthetase [Methylobacterium fujisawaense]